MCSYEQGGEQPEAGTSSLEALEREICELAAHIAAATCRWLELVAEFDDRARLGGMGHHLVRALAVVAMFAGAPSGP